MTPDKLDPIAQYLDDQPEPESVIHDVWSVTESKVEQQEVRLPAYSKWPVALGVGLAATVLLLWLTWPRAGSALCLAGGGAIVASEPAGTPELLLFDDGSELQVHVGARIVPVRNDPTHVVFELERGEVRFDVRPGGPREWVIRSEWFEVRVVGTAFVIEVEDQGGRVYVERGEVEVVERDTDRTIRLRAGEGHTFENEITEVEGVLVNADHGLQVEPLGLRGRGTTSATAPPSRAPSSGIAQDVPNSPEVAEPPRVAIELPSTNWRALAERGEFASAYELLDEELISIGDRLLAVDVARRTGHLNRAVELLESVLAEQSTQDGAGLAAITLGRIQYRRRRYAASLAAFDRAREIGVPSSFVDEVCAQRALARHRVGELVSARRIASECLRSNADTPFASQLRGIVPSE